MAQNLLLQACNNQTGSRSDNVPLVVDLDGTLLRTDLLWESVLRLIRQKPWFALLMPLWLLRGRAYLKRRIFPLIELDVSLLPWHEELLSWLKEEKARGRRLVLATASDYEQACSLARPFHLFETVLGSDGRQNLKGKAKLARIVANCGQEFDYIGNSRADVEVWRGCGLAILVNASQRVERSVRSTGKAVQVFTPARPVFRDAVRSMRCYQWLKNLLLFVPVITSHAIFDVSVAGSATLGFFSFSFAASAAYILNDLLDLEDDRRHRSNMFRPLASGQISIGRGILIAIACLVGSVALAAFLPPGFMAALLTYLTVTTLYSLFFKRLLVVDVLTLAFLYTLRVVAGNLATGIVFSLWLLSFAFFLFLSLAFAKRAADLIHRRKATDEIVPGRGYVAMDLEAVSIAGICSGFLSSLVLALYTNSDAVQLLYHRPALLWGLQPILLYYIIRLWVICRRGELTEDPIQYTVREPSTYGAAVLAALVMLAATCDFDIFGLERAIFPIGE